MVSTHFHLHGPEPAELQTYLSYVDARPHLYHMWSLHSRHLGHYQIIVIHMCEQTAQSCYLMVERLGVKPATSRLEVRHC